MKFTNPSPLALDTSTPLPTTIGNVVSTTALDAPQLLYNNNVVGGSLPVVCGNTATFASLETALRFNGVSATPPGAQTFEICQFLWFDALGTSLLWVDTLEILSADNSVIPNKFLFVKLPIRGVILGISVEGANTTNTDIRCWGSQRSVPSVTIQQDAANNLCTDNILLSGGGSALAVGATGYVFGGLASGTGQLVCSAFITGGGTSATAPAMRFRTQFGSSGVGPGDINLVIPPGSGTVSVLTPILLPRRSPWIAVSNLDPAKAITTWNAQIYRAEP